MKLSWIEPRSPATMREEIGRLGERVLPHGDSACRRRASPCSTRLPLASSTGASVWSAVIAHLERREDVGPVEIIGDAAEALGLALRAPGAAGAVEAPSARMFFSGSSVDFGLEHEARGRRLDDGERRRRRPHRRSAPAAARRWRSMSSFSSSPSSTSGVPGAVPSRGAIVSSARTPRVSGAICTSSSTCSIAIGARRIVLEEDRLLGLGAHELLRNINRRSEIDCGLPQQPNLDASCILIG